jgi:hypothetical protein
MHESKDDELTADERSALAALPRERMPSRLLEERTVYALRERGLLRSPSRDRRPWLWRATRVAAGVLLFAGGTLFGQWLGARPGPAVQAVSAGEESFAAALQVQRTGSEYVNALAILAAVSDSVDSAELQQAREVALAVFRGAADEIARLGMASEAAAGGSGDPEVRHVLWF